MAERNAAAAKPIRTALCGRRRTSTLSIIELLFFAYRDFTSDPDQILADYGFGRAHHRVLHFVNRMPGLTVAELLDVLKITKQSLARVLKQLIDTGHIVQVQGPRDRRQRELYPTAKGRALALALARPQSRRIRGALEESGSAGRDGDRAIPEGDGQPGTAGRRSTICRPRHARGQAWNRLI